MFMDYEETLASRKVQACEVSGSAWLSAAQCAQTIRQYNVEKLRVVESVNNMLANNYLVYLEPVVAQI
jgi:hypothetical protein